MIAHTKKSPTWLHIGAGNIFRIFVAGAQQDLLESGRASTGIIVYEPYDEEIIPRSFAPYENLTLGVTLHADGKIEKRVIASVADAFCDDLPRLKKIIAAPSLQIISLTITEKGYAADSDCIAQLVEGLFARFENSAPPLSIVSLDNFAENGAVLEKIIFDATRKFAQKFFSHTYEKNFSQEFFSYVKKIKFPWTMIDKITPRPSDEVAKILARDGFADTEIFRTKKNTFVAPFVNAEAAQYLVIEDDFANGRPPLEYAGVFFADRETVSRVDKMKVCACLNPLHTILAIAGMLLGYATISECMKDARLEKLLRRAANEALPAVAHPKIIDPHEFLDEVLTRRFPNPYIPDTPARIAADTSQKIPIRFGGTIKFRADELEAVPFFVALWLRYRMGIDDNGAKLELSPDPKLPDAFKILHGKNLGDTVNLKPMLSDEKTFGINLYDSSLAKKIEKIFFALSKKIGAVSEELTLF
ncbi:MAG: mannitol dehydrogenase family protein [Defluviitaleaceae bacterium]|nr:mannitol dehydrogenase family protein [Defluviitaleaceae bacterium]